MEGTILPLGASWIEADQAYNFSLYAKHAESVVLLLFAEDVLNRPLLQFRLDTRVDIFPLARAVAAGELDRGIVICGSGVGASVAANKVRRVRAGLCTTITRSARGSRTTT